MSAGLALPPFDVEPRSQKEVKRFPGLNKQTNPVYVSSNCRRAELRGSALKPVSNMDKQVPARASSGLGTLHTHTAHVRSPLIS